MELTGKIVLVIGLGKTGLAVTRFLLNQGAKVMVTDLKPREEINRVLELLGDQAAAVAVSEYHEKSLAHVDLIIPSPGVAPVDRILLAAINAGVPIISEIELAAGYLLKPMVAITGTNGKTTTASLLGQILRESGRSVFVGGNIGTPLIEFVAGGQQEDYVVAEVSSFQLQWIGSFRPRVAILLNVTDDHADYHGSFARYREIKERIFENQQANDLAIINAGEESAISLSGRLVSRQAFFSAGIARHPGMFLQGERIIYEDAAGTREEYPLDMINIPGRHNIENVMSAVIAAREWGCRPEEIIGAVRSFRGIPHRIEYAGEKGEVTFYDDSKGTNVGAVQRAIETFTRPILLLMGGRDKDSDFRPLVPFLPGRVKELVTFGEAGDKIAATLAGVVKTKRGKGLEDAVREAYRDAAAGDVILLSPGCASFDEFSDYRERGRFFKDVVKDL